MMILIKWEYKEVIETEENKVYLNTLGGESWELITVIGNRFIFKRPVLPQMPDNIISPVSQNPFGGMPPRIKI